MAVAPVEVVFVKALVALIKQIQFHLLQLQVLSHQNVALSFRKKHDIILILRTVLNTLIKRFSSTFLQDQGADSSIHANFTVESHFAI